MNIISPFGSMPHNRNAIAIIDMDDLLETCKLQGIVPDEASDKYKAFETAVEDALSNQVMRDNIANYLLDAIGDVASEIAIVVEQSTDEWEEAARYEADQQLYNTDMDGLYDLMNEYYDTGMTWNEYHTDHYEDLINAQIEKLREEGWTPE